MTMVQWGTDDPYLLSPYPGLINSNFNSFDLFYISTDDRPFNKQFNEIKNS